MIESTEATLTFSSWCVCSFAKEKARRVPRMPASTCCSALLRASGSRAQSSRSFFLPLQYVTPEQAAAGVVVRCASHGGSKFKLLKFDVDVRL